MTTLKTSISGIEFENPFILASAPPTATIESISKAFSLGWGGAVIKTITPDNLEITDVSPRYSTLQSKNNNIIGFQNIELLSHKSIEYWCDGIRFLKEKYPEKVVIASIMAPVQKEAWQDVVYKLNQTPADAFELNFSCPHGMPERNLGMAIGTSTEISMAITSWVKEVTQKPVFVKLTPNVTDITWIAHNIEMVGVDGFSAINTVLGFMGINLDTFEPKLCVDGMSTYGGCSGEIVKPIGFRCVSQIRKTSNLPILGQGGISTWEDAAQYISLGANAVQVCTAVMLNGYEIISSLKSGLLQYLESKNMSSIYDLHNIAIDKITTHSNLNKVCKLKPQIDEKKCVGCGKCIRICSESEHNALVKTDNKVYVNNEKCAGCSLCTIVCPQQAINMVR